ncbi:MAG: hypothetical protein ABIR71_06400 [Chthoniobacterales bacterium]
MSTANSSFRNGLYAGLLVAVALGVYLMQLWGSEHQVRLHTAHLIAALETKDWAAAKEFIDPAYIDQWGHDRALLMSRLQQILPYARHLQIEPREVIVRTAEGIGEWRARVTVEADPNEVTALIKERVNPLKEPFELKWQQRSKKPWDWKLARASNSALELPSGGF